MPEPTVEEYLRTLVKSRLLPKDLITSTLQEFKDLTGVKKKSELTVEKVADFFIEKKLLTQWQHQKLLGGHAQGFYLGKYRLLRHLGSGGMSNVYLAEHQHMQRKAAIKVLPRLLVQNQLYLKRFYLEARAIAALDHPNIVQAFHFDNEGDTHYMVMQYVEGVDLFEQVDQNGPLDPATAAYYIQQAAEGLHHAHQRGLIHRDVKPANLMVDKEGAVRLMDLGLAQMSFHQTNLTEEQKGAVLGTADYLAPEQALDSHNIDARADQYSLGCTFYYLLTGTPPFPTGTIAQRLVAHQVETPRAIEEFRTDVPASLLHIINKLMSKKPEQRYESCEEVAEVLAAWIEQQGDAANAAISQASSLLMIPDFSDAWEFKEDRNPFEMESNTRSFSGLQLPSGLGSSQEIAINPGSRMTTLALLAAAVLFVCAIGVFVWATNAASQKTVAFEWPEGEREGGKITINGKTYEVPEQGEVRFPVDADSAKIEINRPGYDPVRMRADLSDQMQVTLSPDWVLEPQARRRQALAQLTEQVETWQKLPKLSERLAQRDELYQTVSFFRTQWPDTEESTQAKQLLQSLANISVPWDELDGSTVPEEIRKLPNAGPIVAILGETADRIQHNSTVHLSKYSPDGSYLLTCAQQDLPRLWKNGQFAQTLRAESSASFPALQYRGGGFLAGGKRVAVLAVNPQPEGTADWGLYVWDLPEGKFKGKLQDELPVPNLLMTAANSQLLVTMHQGTCYRWNAETLQREGEITLPLPEDFMGSMFITLSPNGETLVLSTQPNAHSPSGAELPSPNKLILLDWAGNQEQLSFSDAAIQNFVFFDNATEFLLLDAQSKLFHYNMETKEEKLQCELPQQDISAQGGFFAEAASLLLTIDQDGTIRTWDIRSGDRRDEYVVGTTPLWEQAVSLHPEGNEITLTFRGSHQVRRLPLGANAKEVGHTVAAIADMGFSPDGTSLTTVAADGKVIRWHGATATPEVFPLPQLVNGQIQYQPESQRIAMLHSNGDFRLFNAESRKLLMETSLRQGPDSSLLTDGSSSETRFDGLPPCWSLHPAGDRALFAYFEEGISKYGSFLLEDSLNTQFAGPTKAVQAFAYQPDGVRFATATFDPRSNEGEVRVQDALTGNTLANATLGNGKIHALRFSPEGRYLALSGTVGDVLLVEAQDDRLTPVETFDTKLGRPIRDVVFDPTEKFLVIRAFNNNISVFRLPQSAGSKVEKVQHFEVPVWGSPIVTDLAPMQISPEGRHLAVANFDGTVWIYRLQFEEPEPAPAQKARFPRR